MLVLLLLFFAAGCTSEHSIHYQLEWRVDRLQRSTRHSAWSVRSDLGYVVTLEQGFLSSHTTELVECDAPPFAPSYGWSLIRPAFAGHMVSVHPTAFRQPRIESLVDPKPARLSRVMPGRRLYCRAHYLIARADASAVGLPTDVDMLGASLVLRGSYARDGAAPREFSLRTAAANDVTQELTTAPGGTAVRFDSGVSGATLHVERDLGALFDGLDFERQPQRQWPRQVLQNLIDHTRIRLEPQTR